MALRFVDKLRSLKYRRFQVDILTILLCLLFLSSTWIILYTYNRQKEAMLDVAKSTIARVSSIINEQVNDLSQMVAQFPAISSGFFYSENPLKTGDPDLILFFLSSIKYHPELYAIYTADMSGNFIGAFNLRLMSQRSLVSDPSTPLPPNALFCVLTQTPQGKECRQYKDQDFKTVSSECYQKLSFQPRIRPWFQLALQSKTQSLVWSDIYQFLSSDDVGLTASKLVTMNGTPTAIVAADVTTSYLSNFISNLPVGKTGKAFLIRGNNEILLPPEQTNDQALIEKILKKLETQKGSLAEVILDVDDETYLVALHDLSFNLERGWKFIVYAPLVDFYGDMIRIQRNAFIISLIILAFASLLAYYFSKKISVPIIVLSEQVDRIRQLDFTIETKIQSNIKEIAQMSNSIQSLRTAVLGFSRYVPKTIVMQLMKTQKEIELGGSKKNLTMMFSDIKDFTHISEKTPTDELMAMLAVYFRGISDIILAHEGTIDKYIGDSVMSFWGAPLAQPNHTQLCAVAAIHCKKFIDEFNEEQLRKNAPCFYTRIGIQSGDVIVGNIGTEERMNYTVIGDAVNTASRLQNLNKVYHTSILVSESVAKTLSDDFYLRPVDMATLKGKDDKIYVYELLDSKKSPLFHSESHYYETLLQDYEKAHDAYKNQNKALAKELFVALQRKYPKDELIGYFLTSL